MKKIAFYSIALFSVAIMLFACNNAEQTAKNAADTVSEATEKVTGAAEATAKTVVNKAEEVMNGGLRVGDTAPDFKLKNIDGKMVALSDMTDAKGFVVTFTCNTCPYAVMYEDRIIDFHKEHAPKGYPVIAINPNDPAVKEGDSFEAMKVRAEEKGFPFVYLFDEGQKVYPAYGATRTPHIYLLDKDLKIQYIGALDDNPQDADAVEVKYVENAIAALEAGETPDPSFTKAIGCTIKTKM